jgi:Ca-activated chloride channel family protein
LSEDVGERFRFNGLPPRGAPFKEAKTADFDGPLNIVYLLDVSGSMNMKSKMSRAKKSLKNAILELQPGDTFNIITFNANVGQYSSQMVKATETNVERAMRFIDDLHTEDGTDFGAGLEKAMAMNSVSHIFLLTDGEPNRGITDQKELRQFVKSKNTQRAQILSVALGQFKGWDLLKGLAEENGGIFQSIRIN